MKKIIYLLMVLGFAFTACEPLDDINSAVDAQKSQIAGDTEYTLTDDDYDALDLSYGSFSSEDDAKSDIPTLLTEMFPVWGKNSSVLVGYQLYIGNASGISDFTYADKYTFTNQDYPGYTNNAFALYPNESPAQALLDIFPNATDGDIVLVNYKQFVSEPVAGITNLLDAGFNGDLSGFEVKNVLGSKDWYSSGYGDDNYAKISAYNDGINEDWLISPEIDLTNQSNLTLNINQTAKYVSDRWDLLSVLISSNYSGDQATATWDALDIQTLPSGNDYTFVMSEDISLTAYEGKKIHIAFKYETTETVAATWEINDVIIKTPGVEGETKNYEMYYNFSSGAWEKSEGVYYVSQEDFSSMGLNNFGSSIPADDYLPTFLGLKYPYAQEEDELIVVYKYVSSSSGAQLRGNLYSKTDGAWKGYQSTISTTLQFGHDGNSWIPDNTIKYTLVSSDYAYMSAELEGNTFFDSVSLTSLASYNDYDYNWSDAQILYSLDLLLDHLNPTAADGQKYLITYLLYDNGTNDVVRNLIKESGEWVWNE